jgi:hypothetical protein
VRRLGITFDRHFLHACHLEFNHPRDGRRLQLSSPLPADLARLVDGIQMTGAARNRTQL